VTLPIAGTPIAALKPPLRDGNEGAERVRPGFGRRGGDSQWRGTAGGTDALSQQKDVAAEALTRRLGHLGAGCVNCFTLSPCLSSVLNSRRTNKPCGPLSLGGRRFEWAAVGRQTGPPIA
jgi:hypothetical protein